MQNRQTNYLALISTITHWPIGQIKIISQNANTKTGHVYIKCEHCGHKYLATGSLNHSQTNYLHISPLFSPYANDLNYYNQLVNSLC